MSQLIVLGIGNRLLRDDGIGIYLVEMLKEQDSTDNIKYVVGETDIDYCLDEIKEADFIIIVDAAKTGGNPGSVTVLPLDKAAHTSTLGLSCHNLHLLDMIGYFHKNLKGIFIGIAVFEVSYGIGLSQILQDAFSDMLNKAQRIIQGAFLKRNVNLHTKDSVIKT